VPNLIIITTITIIIIFSFFIDSSIVVNSISVVQCVLHAFMMVMEPFV